MGCLGTKKLQVLKGPLTNSLAQSSSTEASTQKVPATYGEEMNWCFRVMLEEQGLGQLSLGQKCLQAPLFLCWALLQPRLQMQMSTKSVLSINVASTVCPTLVILWDPTLANSHAQPQPLSVAFPHKSPALTHAKDFPKISQKSTTLPHVNSLFKIITFKDVY